MYKSIANVGALLKRIVVTSSWFEDHALEGISGFFRKNLVLEVSVMAILIAANEVESTLRIRPGVIAMLIEVAFGFIYKRAVLFK